MFPGCVVVRGSLKPPMFSAFFLCIVYLGIYFLLGCKVWGRKAKEAPLSLLSLELYRREGGTAQTAGACGLCHAVGFWHFCFLHQQGDSMHGLFPLDARFQEKHLDVFLFVFQ